jgi:hypothetical protein
MHRPIDPKVDCVFKTLFGSDEHRDLLIHFLNALLGEDLAAPITDVDILNPYNERETLEDKLTVVDVKARDAARRIFQIEIQLVVFANLAPRFLIYLGGPVQPTAAKRRRPPCAAAGVCDLDPRRDPVPGSFRVRPSLSAARRSRPAARGSRDRPPLP